MEISPRGVELALAPRLAPKAFPIPHRHEKPPRRNRWGVLQHVTRRYRSNCSCLCRMLNPARAARRTRICLSGAESRRAHLCLISRPLVQQRNSKNSGKTAPTLSPPPCPTHRRALALMQLGVFSRFPLLLFVFSSLFSPPSFLQPGINNILSRTRPMLLHNSVHLQQYDTGAVWRHYRRRHKELPLAIATPRFRRFLSSSSFRRRKRWKKVAYILQIQGVLITAVEIQHPRS